VILLDTSGMLAYFDPKDRQHAAVRAIMTTSRPPRLLSPFILAEMDYLVSSRIGQQAELLLLDDVAIGAYRLEAFDAGDIASAKQIVGQYSGLNIGLADASIVVLAERFKHYDVLTLDGHFRAMSAAGVPFRLLPSDI